MDFITYIIERELLARRTIALPFIGVISRRRVAASFAHDRSHLFPPRDVLVLTADHEQDGGELIELIAVEAGISHHEAIESYNSWYAAATATGEDGDILTIQGVCAIDLTSYSIEHTDELFAGYLAPMGSEAVSIGRPLDSRGGEVEVDQQGEVGQAGDVSAGGRAIKHTQQQSQHHYQGGQRPSLGHQPVQSRTSTTRRTSTAALIVSIIIATAAALYVAYYYLTKYGILHL